MDRCLEEYGFYGNPRDTLEEYASQEKMLRERIGPHRERKRPVVTHARHAGPVASLRRAGAIA